ncbi:ABC transporter substrate-binding protein [Palleronia sp. LCG004]|uniref:ABC transporter substrate-binding protein n=1 Tax=Palleronia sp. LCG004 TaxID=3079304 RepID=UPI002942DDF3|nr:ABC transporter substrate-binding protein [Palleronia sp. LCG004]WOI58233.1 ABC transporter substrate-binding protein [Palleronia sp. LCG004]
MSHFRKSLLLSASSLILGALAAQAAPSGTLRIGVGAEPVTFDPSFNTLPVGNAVNLLVMDGLFEVDAESQIVPNLATDWGFSEDGMTFWVTVETGRTFSNGKPLDAEAIAASFNRMLDPELNSTYLGLYETLGEAVAVGEDRVEFHMTEPNGHVMMLLANTAASIVDAEAAGEMGAEFGRTPVGSGAYVVDEVIGGERFVLVPNESYDGDEPATLERIEFMAVPEDGSRMALIETGELDIVERVPPEAIETIDALGDAHVINPASMFSINMELVMRGPLEDPKVREALNLSIDREGIIQGILGGLGTPSVGMPGPGTQEELRVTYDPIPFDPDRAKALLEEAGYGEGELTLQMTCPSGRYIKDAQVCQALAGSWQAIGIDAQPLVKDIGSWSQTINEPPENRTDNMGMVGRATAGMDFTLYRLFYTGVGANRTGFSDARVDELLTEGRGTTDTDAQKEIYGEVQQIVWEEQPFVFLWYQTQALGVGDDVQNLAVRPDETLLLDRVTIASDS